MTADREATAEEFAATLRAEANRRVNDRYVHHALNRDEMRKLADRIERWERGEFQPSTADREAVGVAEGPEGWAFLMPDGVGAHYFRDGKSFCGRELPAGVAVYGDVFGAGSDPEECRRCAKRAHDEADALDALVDDVADEDDGCQHEWELRSEHDLWVCAWCGAETTAATPTTGNPYRADRRAER